MELPESLVEEELDRQMNNFAFQLQNSGMSIEQYAKMMGGDLNTMRKAFRPAAEKQARAEVTLRAIIEAEHLEVSEEEVEAEYQNLADAYHMELERVKALAGVDSPASGSPGPQGGQVDCGVCRCGAAQSGRSVQDRGIIFHFPG